MAKRRRRAVGPSRKIYWDGIQLSATNITIAGIVIVVVGAVAQEFMPSTFMGMRGHLSLRSFHATSNVRVGLKLMYVEINDAGTMTGDHSAFDTHEEDIAMRQLYTNHVELPANDDTHGDAIHNFEVNVKSKIKMDPSGKKLLVLLANSTVDSACNISGYLRCAMLMG